jgi:hypothetical protein
VHKAAREVGLNHSSVHERLIRLGLNKPANILTGAEVERLRLEYRIFRDAGRLEDLARSMGRNKTFLCARARALGLTISRNGGPRPWLGKWKYMSEEAAGVLFDRFRRSSLGLERFCRKTHFDSLGFSRTMQRHFPAEYEAVIEAKAPRQTLYRLGRAFEYRVRDDLKGYHYFVLRSPRSLSPVDLVAIRRGAVLFVQCKRGGALGVGEWNELFALAGSVGAIPLLAEMPVSRGITYWRLLDFKDGTKRAQPRGAYQPEHA